MSRNPDRIGKYFTCFHEAMGESTIAESLSIHQNGSVESYPFNHADCDGQGALLKMCEEKEESFVTLPMQRNEKRPPLHRQLLYLKDYLKTMGGAPKPTLSRSPSIKGEPNSVAFKSLSAEASQALKAYGKAHGVTPTTILTWTLHRAIGKQSGYAHHSCNWSIPVSLRGPLDSAQPTANHSVPLFLTLDSGTSLLETHLAIQEQLSQGKHWGAYRMLMLLGRLPDGIYRAIIRRDEKQMAKKGHWFAVLSNMGAIKGDPRIAAKTMLVPTDPTAPLKGIALTWNGRLTLSVSVHHSFLVHSLDAERLLNSWLSILADTLAMTIPRYDGSNLRISIAPS